MDAALTLDLGPVPERVKQFISGEFCDTYRSRIDGGTIIAIRTFGGFNNSSEDILEYPVWKERLKEVTKIWARCDHPNIAQLIGRTTFQGKLAAVYRWEKYGDIKKFLADNPATDRYELSTQICGGVMYLHGIGIIHGNLKGSKITVSSGGIPRIRLCTECTSAGPNIVGPKDIVRVARWTAPEIFGGSERTFASDIYSLGMTILETFTGDIPYASLEKDSMVPAEPLNGRYPSRPTGNILEYPAGNAIWDVLMRCWSRSPRNRPTAGNICAIIHSAHQAEALRSRLVVKEDTTVQDLVSHFEMRGLSNYTDMLQQTSFATATPFADTALANVYKVEIGDQRHVAVKCVKHTTLHKKLKRAARELSCWSSHKHTNILPVWGFAMVKGDFAMVSPWMENGCVTDYVVANPGCNRLELCIHIARAISYLHEHNVVHGDIKGPNVLISDRGTAKVTDFGVSIADHQEIEFSSTTAGAGTQRWQAPEILLGASDVLEDGENENGSQPRDGDSSKEGDVYALGMTMIEIYTGARPYGSMNWTGRMQHQIIIGRLRPPRPFMLPLDDTGNGLWELMQRCWAGSPDDRPTSKEVYKRLIALRT